MDGTIMLGFELDTKEFEEELKDLDKYQIRDKKVKIELDLEDLKKQRAKMAKEMESYQNKITELSQGTLKEKVLANPEYQEAAAKLKEMQPAYDQIVADLTTEQMKLQMVNEYIEKNKEMQIEEKAAVEETKTAVEDKTKAIQKEAEAQKEVTKEAEKTATEKKKENLQDNIDKAKKNSEKMKDSFSGIGMIIGGLALAGIAAAIGLAAEHSEEAKASLEQVAMIVSHIIEDLANLLLPIAEQIIDFIYQAVVWVGVLLEDWFGIDVFTARASDNLKSGVKSARALRKQLMGFDEMNILNPETGSTGALGSVGSAGTSSKISDKYKNMTPREIADQFEKEVEESVDRINNDFATQAGLSVHDWILENIPGAKFIDEKLIEPIRRLLYSTGLFKPATKKDEKQITVVTDTMVNSFKEATKKTDKFSKALIKGAKEQFSSFTMLVHDGMVAVTTSTGETFQMTEKNFDELMKALGIDTQNSLKTVESTAAGVVKTYSTTANGIQGAVTGALNAIEGKSNTTSENTKNSWIQTGNDIINKFAGKGAAGVTGAVTGALTGIQETAGAVSGAVSGALIGIESSANQGANSVINAFNPLPELIKSIFDKINPTFQNAGTATGAAVSAAMAASINGGLGKTESIINTAINAIKQALNQTAAGVGGAVSAALLAKTALIKTISLPRIKLAQGGIVNRPGPGVPVAGEYGREGVIPLDNNRQMSLLANEIAKRIIINQTTILDVDGQELARITKQIMSDQEFASNGG